MAAIITARGVSFELANGRLLFDSASFSLDQSRTALVGPNGVGKTTLARLIAGELAPGRGSVHRSAPLAYVAQREAAPPSSLGEHLATRYAWSALGEQLLDGLDPQASCQALSGGEWMRVRLACALDEDGFWLLDEPTNDLDRAGRELLQQAIRRHRGGLLLISHDRELLALCDEVLELSSRGLARFGGGWQAYVEASTARREGLARELVVARQRREAAVRQQRESAERQAKRNRAGARDAARGGIPKILLGARKRQAQATTGRLEAHAVAALDEAVTRAHLAHAALEVDPVMTAELMGQPLAAQRLVAQASGWNVQRGDWLYPRDLSFTWRGNARIAVSGRNGSGKSTLLAALLGEALPGRGSLRLGALRVLHLDQRLAQLDDRLSVLDNVASASDLPVGELRSGLARFLFTGAAVFQPVGELSGGERLRAALAQGFLRGQAPELLLLDEPTNNLDLANVAFLEALLADHPGALVVVSHDVTFLERAGVTQTFRVDDVP